MKKRLEIVSLIIVIVSLFVACSENSGSEAISTTAVTDSTGITHYYEPVTDDKGNISITAENKGLFVEIKTQSNGKAVTEKDGTYATNEHTTILPIEGVTDNLSTTKLDSEKSSSDTTKNIEDADNVVEFKPTETTEETKPTTSTATEKEITTSITETTIQKETQPATDKDGWITKWY